MLKKPNRNSAAANKNNELRTLQNNVEALTSLTALNATLIRQLAASQTALRWFVEHHEPLTQRAYDERYAAALALFDQQTREAVREAAALHHSAMLQKLLEMHDSKPQ